MEGSKFVVLIGRKGNEKGQQKKYSWGIENFPAHEADRLGCQPFPAPFASAAETKPNVNFISDFLGTSTRFARIICPMKGATALGTMSLPCCLGQLLVNLQ